MNVLVQHDVCCIGSRASVVIDQHNLESLILQSSLIIRTKLVAVNNYPRWTVGSGQRDELLTIEVTSRYTVNSNQPDTLAAEAFLDRRCRLGHNECHQTACVLPGLRQRQAAH